MGEPNQESMSFASVAVEPNGVDCECYDREYVFDHPDKPEDAKTPAQRLGQIRLLVVFKRDGAACSEEKVTLHDGAMTKAMQTVYKEARAPVYAAASEAAYQPAYDAAIADSKTDEEATAIATAAARAAGNQAVIDAGITPGDPTAEWAKAQDNVAAGTNPRAMVKYLAGEDWGRLILEMAWAKTPL